MALNEKQQRFLEAYLVNPNATQAAIEAGYSGKTAYSQGQRLLKHAEIQAALQEAREEASIRTKVNLDSVLLELARIAFSDVRKMAHWNVGGVVLKESTQLDDDAAAAIAEVSQTTGQYGPSVKVKLWSKVDALKQLREHLMDGSDKGEGSIDDALDELDAESPLSEDSPLEE